MTGFIAFMIALPLAVEVLGACYGVFDGWRSAHSRAAGLERLAVPLLCYGALWWLVGVDAWPLLLGALLVVWACQIATFYGARFMLGRARYQAIAIDTDSDDDSPEQ